MFQNAGPASKRVPFPIRRVFTITGMDGADRRGAHAHHKTKQILVALRGGCTVDLDDGKRKAEVRLTKENEGLFLQPHVWHVMRDFEPNTVLLVVADQIYNEKDYIRDYEQFLKIHKGRA